MKHRTDEDRKALVGAIEDWIAAYPKKKPGEVDLVELYYKELDRLRAGERSAA